MSIRRQQPQDFATGENFKDQALCHPDANHSGGDGSSPNVLSANVAAVSEMLKPYDSRLMRCYQVSARINHAANDDAECGKPVELESPPQRRLFA